MTLRTVSFLLLLLTLGAASAAPLLYPPSPRGPVVDDYHGTPVADPWRWLEDLDAPDTRRWIDAQNGLSLPLLASLPARAEFAERLTALWNTPRMGTPEKVAGRLFFTYNDGSRNQAPLYVQDHPERAARILIDPNGLSADGTVALTQFSVSPDGRWVVYGTAKAGSDWNQFRIRNVETGEDLPETLERIKFSGASWTRDSAGFVYSRYPLVPPRGEGLNQTVFDELAHQKLYYHRLRSPQSEDLLLYERPDQPRWFVNGQVTEDGRWLVISERIGSGNQNSLRVRDLGNPVQPVLQGPLLSVIDTIEGQYEVVGSTGERLLVITDERAPRRQVVSLDPRRPERARWRTLAAQSEDTLESAHLCGGQLVLRTMHHAASRLERVGLDGRRLPRLTLPGLGSIAGLSCGASDPELFFSYTDYARPVAPYRVDLRRGEAEALPGTRTVFDPADFVTEQVFYTSKDGTRIPMFLSHRKGLKPNGRIPTYLHGYGGFDIAKVPVYDPSALAWMERGGLYAVANLRGGGEYGREWHEAGTRARKQNVFDDFAAAAGWLIDRGWTSSKHIGIWGRSNGGLLVGAAVNQHPGLWGAAVATVGVMDMLRFHTFTVGYAWKGDYGSSETREGFDTLIRYSPLHTVKPGTAYPPTLIMTGDHDDRVHPAHSYKYTAALQAAQAGPAPILIRVDRDAGHGAGKPVSKVIEEEADKMAFLWEFVAD
ncbi:MAG TPA: prolyl oligopeptidase family serine peptidase [Nevskiaceae bacterium]|nr:prolyl oligopeptidase family serine peptidase [Nevskiaceae bacterium]